MYRESGWGDTCFKLSVANWEQSAGGKGMIKIRGQERERERERQGQRQRQRQRERRKRGRKKEL